jgi:hypothetical protein
LEYKELVQVTALTEVRNWQGTGEVGSSTGGMVGQEGQRMRTETHRVLMGKLKEAVHLEELVIDGS